MLHIKFGLIGHAVSEMFEYYGNIHVYCPGVGPYKPLGPTFFRIINFHLKLIFLKVFPIQMHRQPMLTLS